MTYLFYIGVAILFIIGGLTLKYSYLACIEAKRLYDLDKEMKCGL